MFQKEKVHSALVSCLNDVSPTPELLFEETENLRSTQRSYGDGAELSVLEVAIILYDTDNVDMSCSTSPVPKRLLSSMTQIMQIYHDQLAQFPGVRSCF